MSFDPEKVEIEKLSGETTFNEALAILEKLNAGIMKVVINVAGCPSHAFIVVRGGEDVLEIVAAIEAVEDSWGSKS
ncbi:MAG TPA: hypothetical protein V6C57_16760 [Coleofasciculaceae cyanobacterium]